MWYSLKVLITVNISYKTCKILLVYFKLKTKDFISV